LTKDDPRVQAAVGSIRKNHDVKSHPGMGDAGLYYYHLVWNRLPHSGKAMADDYSPLARLLPYCEQENLQNLINIRLKAEAKSQIAQFRKTWEVRIAKGRPAASLLGVYVASGSMSSDMLYAIYAAVGCTTMAFGFLLLTPATILIVESGIGPLVARLLGLQSRLLRAQLGRRSPRDVRNRCDSCRRAAPRCDQGHAHSGSGGLEENPRRRRNPGGFVGLKFVRMMRVVLRHHPNGCREVPCILLWRIS
jgi:hypothetical protein